MDIKRIIARAEAWKRKTHRLSLDLRLKSVAEAKKFLRENGVVLWSSKAEIPNLLDAILGRVAKDQERVSGKPVENCGLWREQVLQDPEFLDCYFFRKQSTVLHIDLWPFATAIAMENRRVIEEQASALRDARRILLLVQKEGPQTEDRIRKALRFTSPAEKRLLRRSIRQLQNLLVLHQKGEMLDLWERLMPRPVRARADQIDYHEARARLLSATLHSGVMCAERGILRWFEWADGGMKEVLARVLQKKDFMRIEQRKVAWIISRRALSAGIPR